MFACWKSQKVDIAVCLGGVADGSVIIRTTFDETSKLIVRVAVGVHVSLLHLQLSAHIVRRQL